MLQAPWVVQLAVQLHTMVETPACHVRAFKGSSCVPGLG
jgi:hypothetical protein